MDGGLVAHLVAVVVVARIFRYDARIRLARQRGDYVAELHVGEPGGAVVDGLARPHPVARNGLVTLLAAGALARVIPHRQKAAIGGGREVGLPLRTGRASVFNFNGALKVAPLSMERM